MMTPDNAPVPGSAYMLADHLDAALAAGEDILAAGRRCRLGEAGPGQAIALRTAVELIRSLELALVTRVLKAREWSQLLARTDTRFKMTASLFMGGTVSLVEALAEFADAREADFETGDGVTAYFRSRAVIDGETPALSVREGALVTEKFRITGRIELGPLLDLIAAYLNALEVHFTLFAGDSEASVAAAPQLSIDGATLA